MILSLAIVVLLQSVLISLTVSLSSNNVNRYRGSSLKRITMTTTNVDVAVIGGGIAGTKLSLTQSILLILILLLLQLQQQLLLLPLLQHY